MEPPEKLPPQLPPNHLNMHEIAIPTSITTLLLKLPASSLPEVRHRREIGDDGPTGVEPTMEGLKGSGSLVFLSKLHVHITNHVVSEIVADVEGLDLAEL